MRGDYPQFKQSYTNDELTENFLLDKEEYQFIQQFRGDVNRQTVAVLLKTLKYLGYFPASLTEIAEDVKLFIAQQLSLLLDLTQQYSWLSGSRDDHFAMIRKLTDYRFATKEDKQSLENWLEAEAIVQTYTQESFMQCAIERFRSIKVELPSKKELERIVNAALNKFFQKINQKVTERLSEQSKQKLDKLLNIAPDTFSDFDKLKAEARQAGINNLEKEIWKLQLSKDIAINKESFSDIPIKAIKILKLRARNETASEMREHPEQIRYALLACFIYIRTSEIIDDIVNMTIDLIQKVDTNSQTQLNTKLLSDIKKVEGKVQILYRIAEAVVKNPNGSIKEVIFPEIKEEVFQNLVAEYQTTGPQYTNLHQSLMKNKYVHHYRQMLPLILDNITFRSDNRFQPIIEALAVIKRYLGTNYQHFPEDVPLKGVVSRGWEKTVLEQVNQEQKVNRKYYEICVLEKLERALKCKEIWVEGAHEFRNPNEDLPKDWKLEQVRINYYENLRQPIDVKSFIDPIKERMTKALTQFNQQIANSQIVKIITPGRSGRGLFSLTKLEAQSEPKSLGLIKDAIQKRHGMIDLLEVFAEADRLVDFTKFFTHSGTKEIRSRDLLRPLIILALFGEGTNLGVKRVARANEKYSYEELYYVRKTYFTVEALRNAIACVVNKILELRNPHIWGEATSCASDGKHFQSWQQNLQAEFRTRYKGYGVMVYWHVETNAVCIYSKLKTYSSSEVAAMIEGLIRHDTQMRVEKNFVDSHGQSEVAFAFCRLLDEFRLMPRLKRIKYERLYLPDNGMATTFPSLNGVLTRPIRWDLVEPQYDEMVKAGVALKQGYASAEAILRRYNSYNVMHPTYKALVELGKAEKTIFLCEYLPSLEVQREVNEGLNVVENWNSAADFIHYGKQGEIATNSRENQEISLLSLHLLQNCLVLINTILVEQMIEEKKLLEKLSVEDLRAITPLFYSHINPYGSFELDLDKPSFLKAA